jgi:hypothetical protein
MGLISGYRRYMPMKAHGEGGTINADLLCSPGEILRFFEIKYYHLVPKT